MKAVLTFFTAIALTAAAHAQYVVTNPISDVLNEVMHVEDIAKDLEMISNQVEQINALTQQLQQIQAYVKAFGNPEQLLNIVGADALIDSLNTSGIGQTLGQLQYITSGVEALRGNVNGLYQSVGETFTTPGGYELPRAEDLYRKFAATQRASQNFTSVYDDVSQRRTALKGRIAETTEQLQASTTDAETQKLAGVITGYVLELKESGSPWLSVIFQPHDANKATRERPLTPARLLGLLDKAKAYPLLSEYHPEALAGVDCQWPHRQRKRSQNRLPATSERAFFSVNGLFRGFGAKPVKNFRRSLENTGEHRRAIGEQTPRGEPVRQKTGCRAIAAQDPEQMPRGRRKNQKSNRKTLHFNDHETPKSRHRSRQPRPQNRRADRALKGI